MRSDMSAKELDRGTRINRLNDAIDACHRANAARKPSAIHEQVVSALETGRALMTLADASLLALDDQRRIARDCLDALTHVSDQVARPAVARFRLGLCLIERRKIVTQQEIASALTVNINKEIDVRTVRRLKALARHPDRLRPSALPPKTKKLLMRNRDTLRRLAGLAAGNQVT
jgi:hypothetical protein